MLSASEALTLGLVSEVTESDDAFEQRLMDYGQMLASVAPIAARQTKRMLVRIDQPPDLVDHLDDEIGLALHGLASDDGKEAIRAMGARERPDFTGR
jgi:enoyl-CoA hydratase/carnithine racemase